MINCEKETKTMLLLYKSSVNKTHRLQYVNPSHNVFRVWVLIWHKPERHKCGGCELKRCNFFNTKPSYQVRWHISEKICSRRKTCESAQHAPCCALNVARSSAAIAHFYSHLFCSALAIILACFFSRYKYHSVCLFSTNNMLLKSNCLRIKTSVNEP